MQRYPSQDAIKNISAKDPHQANAVDGGTFFEQIKNYVGLGVDSDSQKPERQSVVVSSSKPPIGIVPTASNRPSLPIHTTYSSKVAKTTIDLYAFRKKPNANQSASNLAAAVTKTRNLAKGSTKVKSGTTANKGG